MNEECHWTSNCPRADKTSQMNEAIIIIFVLKCNVQWHLKPHRRVSYFPRLINRWVMLVDWYETHRFRLRICILLEFRFATRGLCCSTIEICHRLTLSKWEISCAIEFINLRSMMSLIDKDCATWTAAQPMRSLMNKQPRRYHNGLPAITSRSLIFI